MQFVNRFWAVFALFTAQLVGTLAQGITPNGWENTQLSREIDLQYTFTVDTFELTIKNIADKPLKQYYITIPYELMGQLSTLTASLTKKEDAFLNCYLFNGTSTLEDGTVLGYGVIELPSPVQPGREIEITAKVFYNVAGKPYPAKMNLGEVQQLYFTSNRLPMSPYLTVESTLVVNTRSKVQEDNKPEDESLQGVFNEDTKVMEFGPWSNTKPNTVSELNLIYKHVTALKEIVNLQRDVWVSNWASTIQFEEYYEMTNKGAALNGGFDRLAYMKQSQMMQLGMIPWIQVLEMGLPVGASEHFCTDKVGMVSTTEVIEDSFFVRPRYPVFGGWFYNFTIGWTNQLSQFARNYPNDDETFLLAVPVLNGPADTVYDHAFVNVYLPEGAEIMEADSPVSYKYMYVNNEQSYFDMNEGHVKLTFEFDNLFTNIGKADLLIKYKYSKTALYKKPLSIAVYFFTALMGFFIIKSLNFSVNK
ncbi:dolichyl-diphosphooligosaccharide--protein glycosyltransferase subunit 1 [Monosporozyma unispora]|nr:dolichyl-diphosphooligosaccharide--protein glycosyltransferase subunit 1 [Kazachstania unispora]